MGLTSWKGSIVRKQDVSVAKNYLKQDEIKDLNEIVTILKRGHFFRNVRLAQTTLSLFKES